jgi:hypothetical protein
MKNGVARKNLPKRSLLKDPDGELAKGMDVELETVYLI